jgi:hypothetical protein
MEIKPAIDEAGRVWFAGCDAPELLLRGFDISALLFQPSPEIDEYNAWCERFDKADYQLTAPPALVGADQQGRVAEWRIAAPYHELDVRAVVLSRCTSECERQRVNDEMDQFEKRNLLPVLRLMFMLVDHFRANNIVWGVGRGSSVASYVLFLIGVHKIDSLAYDLDITEFLR